MPQNAQQRVADCRETDGVEVEVEVVDEDEVWWLLGNCLGGVSRLSE